MNTEQASKNIFTYIKITRENFHQSWQGDLRVWVPFKLESSIQGQTYSSDWATVSVEKLSQAWNATICWEIDR